VKKKILKTKKIIIYALIAPIMIIITIFGFSLRKEKNKNFYLPLGSVGLYLILDKEFNRRFYRKNTLKKVKFFKNNK